MAATGTPTPNIGLRRAQGTDPASVDDINYNSALIDTKLGAVGNSSVQDQIDTLISNLTKLKATSSMWFGVWPKADQFGRCTVSVPMINPDKKTPTITAAYKFSNGAGINITSDLTVNNIYESFVNVAGLSTIATAGDMIRIEMTLA